MQQNPIRAYLAWISSVSGDRDNSIPFAQLREAEAYCQNHADHVWRCQKPGGRCPRLQWQPDTDVPLSYHERFMGYLVAEQAEVRYTIAEWILL